jgi:hypothetical protein
MLKERTHDKDDSLFRNIFLHNVLDIPVKYDGTVKDFKLMLKKWSDKNEKMHAD